MIRLYAKPHSRKLLSAQPFDDRLQTLLATRASSRSDTNRSERERDVIASDNQIRFVRLAVVVQQRSHRVPAQVHERLRLYDQHTLPSERRIRNPRIRFIAEPAATGAFKQSINEHE